MLAVIGELNPTVGGLPVQPEINQEVALQLRKIQFSLAPALVPSPTPTQRNRRTLYAYRVRNMADPFLELFHLPNPNDACECRDAAPATPQTFTLLNSDALTDRSVAFALRLEKLSDKPEEQIDHAFRLAFGRGAIPDVLDLSKETKQTKAMYGLDDLDSATFSRQCLLARKLVENGVRFVQLFAGGWDSHDFLERAHTARIRSVDKAMPAARYTLMSTDERTNWMCPSANPKLARRCAGWRTGGRGRERARCGWRCGTTSSGTWTGSSPPRCRCSTPPGGWSG